MFRSSLAQAARSVRHFSSTSAKFDIARFSAIGRIGADLEKSVAASNGAEYLKYPLAVQTAKDHTSWFKVVVFDPNAINFMTTYLKKGSQIYIEADASMHTYELEGQPRTTIQLVQQSINPISNFKKRDGEGAEETAA